MSGQRPKPRRRDEGRRRAAPTDATAEFVRLLGEVPAEDAAARLQLDMARDAGLEALRQLGRKAHEYKRRAGRARDKRRAAQSRLVGLLENLSWGPIVLPRLDGSARPAPEQLLEKFRRLGDGGFPRLAEALRAAVGQPSALPYQRLLVQEIFVNGGFLLVEHLVRRAAEPLPAGEKDEFLDELRHHLAGKINRALARQTEYRVTPDVGKGVDTLLGSSLRFLADLMSSRPPGRLLIPTLGEDFDPRLHEPVNDRPGAGALIVRATIFPGLVVAGEGPRVLERARIYTKEAPA